MISLKQEVPISIETFTLFLSITMTVTSEVKYFSSDFAKKSWNPWITNYTLQMFPTTLTPVLHPADVLKCRFLSRLCLASKCLKISKFESGGQKYLHLTDDIWVMSHKCAMLAPSSKYNCSSQPSMVASPIKSPYFSKYAGIKALY